MICNNMKNIILLYFFSPENSTNEKEKSPQTEAILLEFAHKIYIAIDSIATISCFGSFVFIFVEMCA